MDTKDTTLLQRWVLHRNAEAFNELVRRHSGMVFNTCKRILGNASDAEEVTQECFLALAHVGDEPPQHLTGWLHRVATFRSLDWLRSAGRRQRREAEFAALQEQVTQVRWRDVESQVDEAIAQLPEGLRFPVVAHFLQGQTHQAVADELGVSRRVVTHRIAKGIETVRAHLRRKGFTLSVAALTELLVAHPADAVPAGLLAALGKAALSGPVKTVETHRVLAAARGAQTIGGIMATKAKTSMLAAILGLLLLAGAVTYPVVSSRVTGTQPESSSAVTQEEAGRRAGRMPSSMPDGAREANRADAESGDGNADSLVAAQLRRTEASSPGGEAGARAGEAKPEVRPVTLAGYVMDDQGVPLPEGWAAIHGIAVTYTAVGADGHYVIQGAGFPEELVVNAGAEGYQTASKQLTAQAGQSLDQVDFFLAPGVTLKARLTDVDGSPVSGAQVSVRGFEGSNSALFAMKSKVGAVTDTDGLFSIGLPSEGWAALSVRTPTGRRTGFGRVPVGEDYIVELQIQNGAVLQGTVTWGDATPAPHLKVQLLATEGATTSSYAVTVTDSNGQYEISGIAPGEIAYRAVVTDESGHPLNSPQDLLPFEAGETRVWDCTLPRSMQVTGRVTGMNSGRGLGHVRVKYLLDDETGGETRTSGDGRYELVLFPFTTAYVYPELDGVAENTSIASYGKSVPWEADGVFTADFRIPEPGTLVLRVTDASGAPLAGANVWINRRLESGDASRFSTDNYTDAGGQFVWSQCQPDTEYWCFVQLDGYVPTETARFTTAGEEVREDVVLFQSAGVEGRLFGPDERVLGNTAVHLLMTPAEGVIRPYAMGDALSGAVADATTNTEGSFTVATEMPTTTGTVQIFAKRPDGTVLETPPVEVECFAGQIVQLGDMILYPREPDEE